MLSMEKTSLYNASKLPLSLVGKFTAAASQTLIKATDKVAGPSLPEHLFFFFAKTYTYYIQHFYSLGLEANRLHEFIVNGFR